MADENGHMTDPPPTPNADAVFVDYDLLCLQCGYNLRTMPLTGRCPECGTNVANSWTPAPPLLWADKKWLAKIRQGMSLIVLTVLLSVILVVGFPLGLMFVALLAPPSVTNAPAVMGIVTITWALCSLCLFILGLVGVFQASAPEPHHTTAEQDPRSRRYCRKSFIVFLVLSLIGWPTVLYVFTMQPVTMPTWYVVMLIWAAVTFVSFGSMLITWICLMLFWKTLATRAAEASLIRQTKTVVWCVAISAGLLIASYGLMGVVMAISLPTLPPTTTAPAGPTAGLGALGYIAPTSLPTTTAAATTMPTSMPMTPMNTFTTMGVSVFSCLSALAPLALLGFGIWWIVITFRYRTMLQRILDTTVDPETPPPTTL